MFQEQGPLCRNVKLIAFIITQVKSDHTVAIAHKMDDIISWHKKHHATNATELQRVDCLWDL